MAGMDALIAPDAEGLVRLAVEVAGDRARSGALRASIASGRGELFDRREPIDALAQALLEAGAGRRPRSSIPPP